MRSIDRAIRIATLSAGKFTKSQVDILRETIKALYAEGGEDAFFSISPIPVEGKENADVWVEGEDLQNGIGLALEETGQTHYSLSVVVSEPAPEYTPPTVSGGDEYDVLRPDGRMWRVHEFKTSGELSVTGLGDDPMVRVVLVGGGGSGGSTQNTITVGGSGAGGSVVDEAVELALGEWPVIVGAGGSYVNGTTNLSGLGGSASSALGLEALGGGYGGAHNTAGGSVEGGNGGGSGTDMMDLRGEGARVGGYGFGPSTPRASGGGAGAGGDGGDASSGRGGDGGMGVQSDITGESRWYGVGAAGSCRDAVGNSPGDAAPGGSAGVVSGQPSPQVDHGTGNGGCGNGGMPSGYGGDGIVYISYPIEAPPPTPPGIDR